MLGFWRRAHDNYGDEYHTSAKRAYEVVMQEYDPSDATEAEPTIRPTLAEMKDGATWGGWRITRETAY